MEKKICLKTILVKLWNNLHNVRIVMKKNKTKKKCMRIILNVITYEMILLNRINIHLIEKNVIHTVIESILMNTL